ncbi:hypothetical protein [Microbispora sp. ATCC PTA-5024]|uniref:hypothetical protein n=1 Tax=Microbispora sp. ATCC PTA-5024 TaxID=316330 RepID=UPI0003DC96E6|nr:hypothetical protein [Microbispora sp. ATCC PTA-5024]ETK35224.1 hypothetical protein MPTA5024_15295 [Microbispora sp. ATCC PTA-5024]
MWDDDPWDDALGDALDSGVNDAVDGFYDGVHDVAPDDEPGGPEEIRFGQVLPQEGLSEDGDPVAYSTSYDEYYDTVTNEEVEPK